jgi:hypothetical protein
MFNVVIYEWNCVMTYVLIWLVRAESRRIDMRYAL